MNGVVPRNARENVTNNNVDNNNFNGGISGQDPKVAVIFPAKNEESTIENANMLHQEVNSTRR
jgi:hypothetical protein